MRSTQISTWHIVNVCSNYKLKGYTEIFIQLPKFTTRGREIQKSLRMFQDVRYGEPVIDTFHSTDIKKYHSYVPLVKTYYN